ncbi:MAG: hypothetical protein Q7S21_00740 [archaeon]|nr:hypothetical protein [archaeon]
MQKKEKNAFVMDSAMILNDFNFFFPKDKKYYTTSEIVEEIRDFRSRQILQQGFYEGVLEIKIPSQEAFKKVEQTAKAHNLLHRLSEADKSIIALAFDLKLTLISDDQSVHRVCKELKLEFETVIRRRAK